MVFIILFGVLLLIPFTILPILISIQSLAEEYKWYDHPRFKVIEVVTVFFYTFFFLKSNDFGKFSDCCGLNAVFDSQSRLSMYVLIFTLMTLYFISSFRKAILPPILEVLVNIGLILGVLLNIVIGIHLDWSTSEMPIFSHGLVGNLPIGLLFLAQLVKNQRRIMKDMSDRYSELGYVNQCCHLILNAHLMVRFPLFIILGLPFIAVLTSILLLFGQKPNALVTAFTDTYYFGFSEMDHLCANIDCGGHYLCSVAANGHHFFVQSFRYGKRGNALIVCNRQLLISNAFEQIIEDNWPRIHAFIRLHYDKVGDMIHNNYEVYQNRYYSDLIYIAMKPAEWFFLLIIYAVEKDPESMIEMQYV